jgi:hypothetical protein
VRHWLTRNEVEEQAAFVAERETMPLTRFANHARDGSRFVAPIESRGNETRPLTRRHFLFNGADDDNARVAPADPGLVETADRGDECRKRPFRVDAPAAEEHLAAGSSLDADRYVAGYRIDVAEEDDDVFRLRSTHFSNGVSRVVNERAVETR